MLYTQKNKTQSVINIILPQFICLTRSKPVDMPKRKESWFHQHSSIKLSKQVLK